MAKAVVPTIWKLDHWKYGCFCGDFTGFWQNGSHLSRFQMVWLPDFKSHANSGPFAINSKSRLVVQISDPHYFFPSRRKQWDLIPRTPFDTSSTKSCQSSSWVRTYKTIVNLFSPKFKLGLNLQFNQLVHYLELKTWKSYHKLVSVETGQI